MAKATIRFLGSFSPDAKEAYPATNRSPMAFRSTRWDVIRVSIMLKTKKRVDWMSARIFTWVNRLVESVIYSRKD